MKFLALCLLLLCIAVSVHCQESENDKPEGTWWARFKQKVKTILAKWRDDMKLLWDDVLTKADDMKGWTSDMFDSFKMKMKEWLETRKDVSEDDKNEIETFISKLKIPTEAPKPKIIDP